MLHWVTSRYRCNNGCCRWCRPIAASSRNSTSRLAAQRAMQSCPASPPSHAWGYSGQPRAWPFTSWGPYPLCKRAAGRIEVAVRGLETKPLVLLAVALMLVSTPCLAACIACSAPSSFPPCHHQVPPRDDGRQPCPHQLFCAMAPSIQASHSPVHQDAGFTEVQASAEPPRAPIALLRPAMGLSPPHCDLAGSSILRI
jgi:hypothetical protein